MMYRKWMTGFVCGVCVIVAMGLTGCGKKKTEEAAAPSVSDRAAQEITQRIQEPQNRARELQDQIMQADQRNRDAVDKASQ